jgi:DNA-binding response OmpR family regulator
MLVDADKQAFNLTCVDSLRAAEKHLNEENINAVLLDLSLPDGSGLETLQKMVKIAPKTPIIVLTDTEDENLAVKAVQTGAQDYLVKGHVDGALLVRSIRYSIERKRIQEYLVSNESRYRILT